jgi:hypothetical protein
MRTLLVVLTFLLASAAADAEHMTYRFVGIHPIPKSAGGGFCHIEGPHVHVYVGDKLQFRMHDGAFVFVGDPVAYGYADGPRYAYKGHHPVHVDRIAGGTPAVEYCYIDGPHYHAFAPPDGELVLAGGAYFYTGAPPHAYVDARPTMIGINTIYTPIVYARPVVTVVAPAGWIGARIDVVAPRVVTYDIAPIVVVDHHHHEHEHHHHHHKHERVYLVVEDD